MKNDIFRPTCNEIDARVQEYHAAADKIHAYMEVYAIMEPAGGKYENEPKAVKAYAKKMGLDESILDDYVMHGYGSREQVIEDVTNCKITDARKYASDIVLKAINNELFNAKAVVALMEWMWNNYNDRELDWQLELINRGCSRTEFAMKAAYDGMVKTNDENIAAAYAYLFNNK